MTSTLFQELQLVASAAKGFITAHISFILAVSNLQDC